MSDGGMDGMEERFKLLDLYSEPLSGPMIEVYRRLRADFERIITQERCALDQLPPVMFRTVEDGVPLCAHHAQELLTTDHFAANDLRPVWDDEAIEQIVTATGQRLEDLQRLHGRFYDQRCALCGVTPSLNRCLTCQKVLHPQWPAVYCSNRCALEDA